MYWKKTHKCVNDSGRKHVAGMVSLVRLVVNACSWFSLLKWKSKFRCSEVCVSSNDQLLVPSVCESNRSTSTVKNMLWFFKIPSSVFKLVSSTGKSRRLRWFNQLDPRINRKSFTEEEEERLLAAHHNHGNKMGSHSQLFPVGFKTSMLKLESSLIKLVGSFFTKKKLWKLSFC